VQRELRKEWEEECNARGWGGGRWLGELKERQVKLAERGKTGNSFP
jgi:hypothetical protein